MPKWSLEFGSKAEKDIFLLDKADRVRVINKIDWCVKNFNDILPIILTADFREYFKLRVGDWRIFYKVNWRNNIILIEYIEHRSKAYKKRKK